MAQKTKVKAKKVKLSELIGKITAVVVAGTGEVVEVEDDLNTAISRPKAGKLSDFVKVDQKALLDWAKNKSVDAYRVMMVLMGKLSYGGKVAISQTEIGELIGIKRPNVTRAMKALQRDGLVKMVKRGLWRVSHWFCFKGGTADLIIAQQVETNEQIAEMIAAIPDKIVDTIPRSIVEFNRDAEVDRYLREGNEGETGWFYDEGWPALAG